QRVAALQLAGVSTGSAIDREISDAADGTDDIAGEAARRAIDVRDRNAVATAYAQLPRVTMPRWPLATIAAGCASAASLVGLVVAIAMMAGSAPHVRPPRAEPPPVAGAFATGGVPARDAELERVLVEELTELVVDVDRAHGKPHGDPSIPARLD